MSNERIINRKERRAYMKKQGMLKTKTTLNFEDWCTVVENNIKEGNQMHLENEDTWRNLAYDQLSVKESNIVKNLKEQDYSKEEINSYLEKWYKTI